jgi:hypothetical protein
MSALCGRHRFASDKSPLRARCGGCHRPLFDGHPAAVDAVRFEKHCRDFFEREDRDEH